jgi:hypothetical protein
MSRRKCYHFKQSPFFRLRSKTKLAKLLYLSPRKLKELSKEAHVLYLEREIYNPEKGKCRQVETPTHVMRTVHDRIRDLMNSIEVPDYIFSPRQGGSTIQNALSHQANPYLFKIDIKKYFPSITKQKIYNFFYFKMECSKDVAATLAVITTVSEHLPTGSPLSPIMSYHVNSDMWEEIFLRTLESGCKLSVWVDDICVSGAAMPGSMIWDIQRIIYNHKFSYHKEKAYSSKKSKNITGIIVTPKKIMPRKGQYKKLRDLQERTRHEEDSFSKSVLESKVEGLRNYIREVENSSLPDL